MDEHQPRTSGPSRLQKLMTVGGPVTCVSLVTAATSNGSSFVCVYGQGSGLHRVLLQGDRPQSTSSKEVFDNGTVVHGIKHFADDYTVVFGGRYVAVLENVTSNIKIANSTLCLAPLKSLKLTDKTTTTNYVQVSDWIWNIQCQQSLQRNTMHILIGLAHNSVELWSFTRLSTQTNLSPATTEYLDTRRLQIWKSKHGCLTYCVDFCNISKQVAMGTAMQDVRVWSLIPDVNKQHTIVPKEEACLIGHQGVVHNLKWISKTQQLVSVSDDRSVRLWSPTTPKGWNCQWIGWGHTARVWGIGAIATELLCEEYVTRQGANAFIIVTAGEDNTVRLWLEGKQVGALRGHRCPVWSVDCHEGWIATGANDGSVAFHHVDNAMAHSWTKDEANISDCLFNSVLLVPDDRVQSKVDKSLAQPTESAKIQQGGIDAHVESVGTFAATRKVHQPLVDKLPRAKKKNQAQVIVGMKFYKSDNLLIVTRSGTLFAVNTSTKRQLWENLGSWSKKDVDPAGGCSLTCYFEKIQNQLWIAVGTTKGEIVVVIVDLGNRGDTVRRIFKSCKKYRSVQRLAFPSAGTLLSFHVNTTVLLEIKADFSISLLQVLDLGTNAIPISFAWDRELGNFFVGDTRGNLVMFQVGSVAQKGNMSTSTTKPSGVLARLHKKEHVTDIVLERTGRHLRVLSVGNDGCIAESFFDKTTKALTSGVSVSASSALTGIVKILSHSRNEHVVVAGYYGNTFVILDTIRGYELFRVDTGGRQRQFDFASCLLREEASCSLRVNLAVAALRKHDGRNEIMLHANKTTPDICRDIFARNQHNYSLGFGLHGETIYSAAFFDRKGGNFALLTGSEDCWCKISSFRNGRLATAKRLPPQESCVRSVCCSTGVDSEETLLVAGGGKLTLQFFLVKSFMDSTASSTDDIAAGVDGESAMHVDKGGLQVYLLGHGRTSERACIDHRINAAKALLLENNPDTDLLTTAVEGDKALPQHIVAAGDSQGNCHIYKVTASVDERRRSWIGLPLPKSQSAVATKPVLSLDLAKVKGRVLLLVGTTGGNIDLWDLPGTTSAEEWKSLTPMAHQNGVLNFPANKIGSYIAHQMGTNSISAKLSDCSRRITICSGGDDQAVSLCDIQLEFDVGCKRIQSCKTIKLTTMRDACFSAVKGVFMLHENSFLTVGYGQRLAYWKRRCPANECGDDEENCDYSEKKKQFFKSSIGARGARPDWDLHGILPVSVGDVNCLAATKMRTSSTVVVAVCGSGVDLISLDTAESRTLNIHGLRKH